jgi:hypothetical protein
MDSNISIISFYHELKVIKILNIKRKYFVKFLSNTISSDLFLKIHEIIIFIKIKCLFNN